MAITRVSSGGFGARRSGSFASKYVAPVVIKTRLGSSGFGVRRSGSFAGKTASITSSLKTRLGSGGFGVRRAGSFLSKSQTGSILASCLTIVRRRRR